MKHAVIGEGAEGKLFLSSFEGKKAVKKIRMQKKYRHPSLDARLRRQRTRREAKVLRSARSAGVPCPQLFQESEEECELALEFVEGRLLSQALSHAAESRARTWMQESGRALARLHQAGIVHGDFTTSNVMVRPTHQVSVIDFGLAGFVNSVEEQAIDVLLFTRSLEGEHAHAWAEEFFDAYASENSGAGEVRRRMGVIRSRGRYQQRQ